MGETSPSDCPRSILPLFVSDVIDTAAGGTASIELLDPIFIDLLE